MGRPKGSLNRKTITGLENLATHKDTSDAYVKDLQDKVGSLTQQIENLTKLVAQKNDPTLKMRAEGNITLNNLDSAELLTEKQISDFEHQKSEAIRELNGVRKVLMSSHGGGFKAIENQTGDEAELKRRIYNADKAIHYGTVGKITDVEKDRLLSEYKSLTEELRRIVPSHSDQWNTTGPNYQEAVQKCQALMTTYASKVRRWQNIGKILYPEDSKKYDLWSLSK